MKTTYQHIYARVLPMAKLAAKNTKKAAEVKDWRLDKEGRRMKAVAAELSDGKGYIIGSAEAMAVAGLITKTWTGEDLKLRIWGIMASTDIFGAAKSGKMKLSFVAYR